MEIQRQINLEEIFRKHNKTGFWQKETVDNVLFAMPPATARILSCGAYNF